MPATPQSQAIALANQILALDSQMAALLEQVNQTLIQWSDTGASNILNSLPTAPVNADGTLGTPDTEINTAHPIDTRIITGLSRAISAADLSAIAGYPLPNFQLMCNGSAINALGGMRQIINKAVGG